MIILNIYNNLSEEGRSGLTHGLISGLIGGLIFGSTGGLISGVIGGLTSGLFSGLILGLIFGLFSTLFGGLISGLIAGLTSWLIYGLIFGLFVILTNFLEALPFINGTLSIVSLIFGIIILMEFLFWLSPKEKVKKRNLIKHTLLRKGEALLETLMIFSAITQIYVFTREIDFVKYFPEILKCFVKYFPEILKWIEYIGAGAIALGILILIGYGFIKLNSGKYV